MILTPILARGRLHVANAADLAGHSMPTVTAAVQAGRMKCAQANDAIVTYDLLLVVRRLLRPTQAKSARYVTGDRPIGAR